MTPPRWQHPQELTLGRHSAGLGQQDEEQRRTGGVSGGGGEEMTQPDSSISGRFSAPSTRPLGQPHNWRRGREENLHAVRGLVPR